MHNNSRSARRCFLIATGSVIVGLAGCSESNEQEVGEEDTSQTSEDSDETESESATTNEGQDSETPENEQYPQGEENEIGRRLKQATQEEWIQLPSDGITLPEYNENRKLVSQNNVVESMGDDIIATDRTGIEGIREFVANNVIGEYRTEFESIILIYQDGGSYLERYADPSVETREYVQGKNLITGWSVIPSIELDDQYPEGVDSFFDESAIESFFQDHVSDVKDVSENFPDELLEYAEG